MRTLKTGAFFYLEMSKILLYYDNIKPGAAACEQVGIRARLRGQKIEINLENPKILLTFVSTK